MKKLLALLLVLTFSCAYAEELPEVPQLEPLETAEAVESDADNGSGVSFTITAAGDCTLGGEVQTGIDKVFASCAESKGLDYFFSGVRDIFENDDITLVNLEGPLTDCTEKRKSKKYVMRGSPEYTGILTAGSVEAVSLSNNHTLDFGETGYNDTKSALDAAGIGHFGGSEMYTFEKDGYTIGFIGFEKWDHTSSDAVNGVKAARDKCDLLIVTMHWGEEYDYTYASSEQKLGRALIDAGADLVIGTHPHVIQGIERYNGKYIVYSLGNFCFGGNTDPDDKDCYIFRQRFTLDENGVTDAGISVIPCSISSSSGVNDYRPKVLEGSRKSELAKKIISLSSVSGAILLDE